MYKFGLQRQKNLNCESVLLRTAGEAIAVEWLSLSYIFGFGKANVRNKD